MKKRSLICATLLMISAGVAQQPAPSAYALPLDSPTTKQVMRIRVSEAVARAFLVHKVEPVYPEEARRKQLSGKVALTATIDERGNIIELRMISGETTFAQSAMEAVRQWKYKPYLLNGQPIQIDTMITVEFRPDLS